MSEKSFIKVHDEDVVIKVEGKAGVFGSLDLQVRAIMSLISLIDFKFAEEIDGYARDKVILQIFDAVGSKIKVGSLDPEDEFRTNVEVSENYLQWILKEKIHELPQIQFLLDREDE